MVLTSRIKGMANKPLLSEHAKLVVNQWSTWKHMNVSCFKFVPEVNYLSCNIVSSEIDLPRNIKSDFYKTSSIAYLISYSTAKPLYIEGFLKV